MNVTSSHPHCEQRPQNIQTRQDSAAERAAMDTCAGSAFTLRHDLAALRIQY
jgi:hypothetical protein